MINVIRMILVAFFGAAISTAAVAQDHGAQLPVVDLSKQPTLYVVGYAHLDTQWRWCYPQTIREYIPNTLHDNFALMDKYPNYVFNFSGSRRYQMMKEYYPADYEKLKTYIAKGQWFPCGSSVDENDANVPSAESLVRHVLYGNHFFKREFGIASDEYMLPDCFGFPAALPSVLAHCGIKGFSTQKLTWGSAAGIPFKVGVWEGPDGKSVVAALDPGAYVGEVREDLSTSDSWLTRVNNNGKLSGVFADYHYFGTGDQGGAPTEQSVAMIEKSIAGTGPLKVISSKADWLFKAITPEMEAKLPRYKGELLLTQHSAGSITSQAFMKRMNRKNELLADAAEKASVVAWWLGAEYPAKRLEDAWYLVLGSQMHDILPGTSHPKAYEYAWNDELLAANQFAAVLTDAMGVISSAMDTQAKGTAVVVFNPLSIEREDVVEVSLPWRSEVPTAPVGVHVVGPDGHDVQAQVLGFENGQMRIAMLARVPSVGFAVFDVQRTEVRREGGSGGSGGSGGLKVSERSVENARYRVVLDGNGDVSSVLDKKANRELLSAPARLAFMYEKPANWPAWNMDWKDRQQPPRSYVSGPARFRVVESGPVRAAIEVTRESEGSMFAQTIRLAAGDAGDRVEFDTTIDWTTRERSLKAAFPLAVSNPKATYDIQVGAIERDNNSEKRYENPSHQWFDLTDSKGDYGVTIANDSKYGSDKPDDSTLRLTLLYTPGVNGDYQDQGTQDIGRHHILYALAGHQGDWRPPTGAAAKPSAAPAARGGGASGGANGGAVWIAARLNQPLRAFVVPAHAGGLRRSFSSIGVNDPRIMVSAVKKAEDLDQVVVRLRELTGATIQGIRVSLVQTSSEALEVDGQERRIGKAGIVDGGLLADVGGYGLRAYALKVGEKSNKAAAPQSKPLDLSFDADAISTNANRRDGAIDADGRTLPAEQLGATISCASGIAFKLGPAADGQKNAVLCQGQNIALPEGEFNRLEVLAASSEGDQETTFDFDGKQTPVVVPSWRGYVGQWDNRIWLGKVPEIAYNWPATYGGLDPGYVKQARVAWFCSHHHAPGGDQHYQYCYLYAFDLDVPNGARTLHLPSNEKIMIFAATLVKSAYDRAIPGAPLFDTLDDRGQDAPRITPAGGSFTDATELRIEPRLYGHADAIRFTLDGADPTADSPKYEGPIVLEQPATVRAAVLGVDGKLGPIAEGKIDVNDQTPPRVLKTEAVFNQPTVRIAFSEPLEKGSATGSTNYVFEPGVNVRTASLQEPGHVVVLTLDAPLPAGQKYMLHIRGVKDDSPAQNAIGDAALAVTAPAPVFQLAQVAPEQRGTPIHPESALPVKGNDAWTLNMFVRTEKETANRTVIAGFGACGNNGDATGRYICKFANGIHFWGHHSDLEGNSPLELNQWQMLTATYDGATLRLYKNGQMISEREAHLADDEAVINIAPPDPWEHKRQFDGQIRELTIWNAALDEPAIKLLQAGAKLP